MKRNRDTWLYHMKRFSDVALRILDENPYLSKQSFHFVLNEFSFSLCMYTSLVYNST